MTLTLVLAAQLLATAAPDAPAVEATPGAPSSPAASPPAATADAETPQVALEWYGWQVLALDGAAVGLGAAAVLGLRVSAGSGGEGFLPFGAVGGVLLLVGLEYQFGAPLIIHNLLHQNYPAMTIDLVVRLLGPLAGALAGLALDIAVHSGPETGPASGISFTSIGALVGLLGPIAYDASVLSRAPARAKAPPASAAFQWAPVGGVVNGSPFAGVAGTF
jgi:hypothetical protein